MTGVITSITEVFSAMAAWIKTFILSLIDLFYTAPSEGVEGGLTFLGTLSVIALAISVFFLIMGLIQNFLHLRG